MIKLELWRGNRVDNMSRDELITALTESCELTRVHKDEFAKALSRLTLTRIKALRLARADGIFIGVVFGMGAGVFLASAIASAFFLLTRVDPFF